jgi:hypothetical protein
MGQESDAIKQYIDAKRQQLGQALNELEYRIRKATDLKTQYEEHTGAAMGAAFGAGLLLAMIIRNSYRLKRRAP